MTGVVVHHRDLAPDDVVSRGSLPITRPGRTLVDLSGICSAAAFDDAFHHCIRTRLVTLSEMEKRSDAYAGRGAAGARLLRGALAAYRGHEAAPASVLEGRVVRLLARSGLPAPERQYEVRVPGGGRRYLDFAWPQIKLAVEADGYRWHSSRSAWARDRQRLRELVDQGWEVISVTYEDLARPQELLRILTRAHRRRSTARR